MPTLQPGTVLGSFEILSLLGVGGMGEVYQARDTKLGRDVAIKILPEEFAKEEERLQRFEREAKILAALTHPNIAAIHEFQQEGEIRFLVMELVEGDTLSELISQGKLSIKRALPIFAQIAEALETAHSNGIIHRDLKPVNVKITYSGIAKVLDFGIAKLHTIGAAHKVDERYFTPMGPVESSRTGSELDATLTPTHMTDERSLMGTPSYMSPEQVYGKPLDKRTDIWAWGCCFFEALTGRTPFPGKNVAQKLNSIVSVEPDWELLPDDTPENIRVLLRRALEKDIKRRLRDLGDGVLEINDALTHSLIESRTPTDIDVPSPSRGPTRVRLLKRLSINIPPAIPVFPAENLDNSLAMAPDGSRLVYLADSEGSSCLAVRELDQLEVNILPGTEGARQPFFSPDGQWIGYFTQPAGKLKKVSVQGGAPVTLCDAPLALGASWGEDDHIVFASDLGSGLKHISSSGGRPENITNLDADEGEIVHGFPCVLPGAEMVLFGVATGLNAEHWSIELLMKHAGERHALVKRASRPAYASSGHLIYVQQDSLTAAPFDAELGEITGASVPLTEDRMAGSQAASIQYSFSNDGTLGYLPEGTQLGLCRTLVWVDRDGNEEPLEAPPLAYSIPRISPDGSRIALSLDDQKDVWVYDIAKGTLSRLTFGTSFDFYPLWTPDGQRIVFTSGNEDSVSLFWKSADGTGAAEQLTRGRSALIPYSWSSGGKELLFHELRPDSGYEIGVLTLEDTSSARPLVRMPFDARQPSISPDGKWIAYMSNESDRYEIYVQPFPDLSGKWQVSTEGGMGPIWAVDGSGLYYSHGDSLMQVKIDTGSTFSPGKPEAMFEGRYYRDAAGSRSFDISPDGERFLMIKSEDAAAPATELVLVQNWFDELRRRVPLRPRS